MPTEDKILDRVSKLLAQAEHPNTSDAEREAFFAKADAMMAKHQIDEAMLRAAQTPEQRRKPVVVEANDLVNFNSVYGQKMLLVARVVARTVGVKLVTRYAHGGRITLVGFDEDVRWMQMLFMNIQMAFLTKITPKWSDERTPGHNLALLRESGLSWKSIAERAARAGYIEDTWSELRTWAWDPEKGQTKPQQDERWRAELKLERIYRRHCKENNIPVAQVTRHEAYRTTYADAFTRRICARLEQMEEDRKSANGPGTELVLFDIAAAVNEALWEAFPNLHPDAIAENQEALAEQQRQQDEAHAAWLASLTPAARLRYEKEQTAKAERDARESDRYWRKADKERARRYDSAGARAGAAAADGVNLNIAENVDREVRPELG